MMNRTVVVAAMSLGILSLAPVASADTLVMRDGTRVEGTVTGIAARTITFRHADGVTRRYTTSQVEALEFTSAERANPRALSGRRLEVPTATEIVVRTVEMIDSRRRGADQNFATIVERDVTDAAGLVIIPGGSSVQLVIRQLSPGGATTGSPEMVLDLQSIAIEGRPHLVNPTAGAPESAAGTVDPGAAFATIVKAIAGAGNDAATGGSGTADGAGMQALTRGRDVRVPAGTVLTFRLDSAVTLQAP